MAHLKYTASRIHNNNIIIVFIIILFPSCAQCYIISTTTDAVRYTNIFSLWRVLWIFFTVRTPDDDRRIKLLFCKVIIIIIMFTDISLSLLILVYILQYCTSLLCAGFAFYYVVLVCLTRAYYSVLSVALWPRDPVFEIWYLGGGHLLSRKQSAARWYDYTDSTLYLSLSWLYP